MNAEEFRRFLVFAGACSDALDWSKDMSLEEAWNKCLNPTWMIWLGACIRYGTDDGRIFPKMQALLFERNRGTKTWLLDACEEIRQAFPASVITELLLRQCRKESE